MNAYYSQNNNIYSSSGYAPTTGGNIYSQPYNNIYSQNSGNIYQPPQNQIYVQPQANYIPPPIVQPVYSPGGINPAYGAQVQVTVNASVPPTNEIKSPPQVESMTLAANIEPASTSPLIPSSNSLVLRFKSFCSSSEPVPELSFGKKTWIICSAIIFMLLSLNCITFALEIRSIKIGFFLFFDILLFIYGIFIQLSCLKIRCMRNTTTLLSAILFFAGIVILIIELKMLNEIPEEYSKQANDHGGLSFVRLFWLFIVLHALFRYHWEITLCKCFYNDCCDGVSSSIYNSNYNSETTDEDDNNDNNDDNNSNDDETSNSPRQHHHPPSHHHHSPASHHAHHHSPEPHHAPHHEPYDAPHHAPHGH